MDLTGFAPKYNTFNCCDTLTHFHVGEAVAPMVDQRAAGVHLRGPR
jgi:hypothetical protein